MSNPGVSKLKSLSITGNDTVDAFIRYGLVVAFTFLTGTIMGWLNAHGFNDPNLTVYVPAAVAGFLGTVAVAAWGIIKASRNSFIIQLREAIGVQAGIKAAEAPQPTPCIVTVADAQKVIADHAPETIPPVK